MQDVLGVQKVEAPCDVQCDAVTHVMPRKPGVPLTYCSGHVATLHQLRHTAGRVSICSIMHKFLGRLQ